MTISSVEGSESRYIANFVRFLIDGYISGRSSPRLESFYEKSVEYSYHVNPLLLAQIMVFFRVMVGPCKCLAVLQVAIMARISATTWAKAFYNTISQTPKDILNVVGVLQDMNLKMTNAMRKGYGLALERFTEKELAACISKKENPRLIDVIILVHPKHTHAIGRILDHKVHKVTQKPEQVNMKNLFKYKVEAETDIQEFIIKISTLQFKSETHQRTTKR